LKIWDSVGISTPKVGVHLVLGLFYGKPLVVILLMVIDGYFIRDYYNPNIRFTTNIIGTTNTITTNSQQTNMHQ
jgi:hypothetical protein